MNYTGAYGDLARRRCDESIPGRLSMSIGYQADGGSGWLANAQFNLRINNALDQRPPPSSTSST